MKSAEFEALVEQHYSRIRRAATLLAGDRWDADDLAQETFLQALRSWSRFGRRSRVDTWLYSILLNLHRRRLRSRARSWRRLLEWFRRTPPPTNGRPEQLASVAAERREELHNVWGVVATLPVAQQHALVLRYSEGLTYEQIAEAQQCPLGTVKSRLHHGLASLKDQLAPESENQPRVPFLADSDHDSIHTKIRS